MPGISTSRITKWGRARDHLEGFNPSCGRLDDVAVPEVLKVLAESVEKV